MITNAGSGAIGRTLSEGLGGYIAIGVGNSAPQADGERLDFEVYRTEIRSRSYDATTKTIIYAATLPDSVEAFISEVAILTSPENTSAGGLIAVFDPTSEDWSTGEWVQTDIRVGEDGLKLANQVAATKGATRVSLATTGQADLVQIAYVGTGGNVEVMLMNTDEDYFSVSFSATLGYNVHTVPMHEMTVFGTPDINSVSGVAVSHSGVGSVVMDAIKVTPIQENESMLLRQLFSTPHRKASGMPLDIEIPVVIDL